MWPGASMAAASSGVRRYSRTAYYPDVAPALLIIDFQNDFTEGGALAVPDGDAIAGRVSELIDSGEFDLVVATRDWHPRSHLVPGAGRPLAAALRAGQPRRRASPSLDRSKIDAVVDAGYRPELEGYSGFEETDLAEVLREPRRGRGHGGGAWRPTTASAQTAARRAEEGFRVTVDRAGIRGIDVERGDSERALDELRAAGAAVT